LKEQQEAVPLRDSVCRHGGDPSDNVLLLPSHFSFDASSAAWREVCPLMDNLEGSVAFGARLPGTSGRFSFPWSPTWVLYEGKISTEGEWGRCCSYDVPLLLRRRTFCDVFPASTLDFRLSSYALQLLLTNSGAETLTYPVVMFDLIEWTHEGAGCLPHFPPTLKVDRQAVANLKNDPQLALFQAGALCSSRLLRF
jgi:hypothetical protein